MKIKNFFLKQINNFQKELLDIMYGFVMIVLEDENLKENEE